MEQRTVPIVAIDKRLANALFSNARVSNQSVDEINKFAGYLAAGAAIDFDTLQSTLKAFSEHYGGLWVGGKATLTDRQLMFEPNSVNRFIHENGDELRLNLDLKSIDSVATRSGWITDIIDIKMRDATISLRCFRAKSFTASLEQARLAAIGGEF